MKNIKVFVVVGFILLLLFALFSEHMPEIISDFEFEIESLENWSRIEKKGNQTWSSTTGNLALLCILIGIAYPFAKFLLLNFSSSANKNRNKLEVFLSVHIIFCIFGIIFTLLHAHYAGATSVLLILSVIAMFALALEGILIRYMPDLGKEQAGKLLQAKNISFGLFLFMAILGHILAVG